MSKNFGAKNYKELIPNPICEAYPQYNEFYEKAWELAFDHIKFIEGMPQNPYMDEAFCATQVWIWDTCFMTLFCKYCRDVFPGVETLNNFYETLYGEKRMPIITTPDDEPSWTRAVPGEPYRIVVHIADNPPLFAWAEYQNALISGDKEYIKTLLYERKFLQKHFEWFDSLTELHTSVDGVLMRTWTVRDDKGYHWEGGISGMDNTPRGRVTKHCEKQRPNNPDMLWIDAICQQALSAKMIAELFKLIDDTENEKLWLERYNEKKAIVNKYYWDDEDKFYYDLNCKNDELFKIMTIASYWTMTAEIASSEQADHLVKQLFNEKTLHAKAPFLSLSRSDNDYCKYGQYWRGGVWLPTAYATVKGLENYGKFEEAHTLATELLNHMYKTYTEFEPHTIWEAYSPEEYKPSTNETGRPEYSRPDFCGWSALGPISMYIEQVLGFHSVDAFTNTVKWQKPDDIKGEIGIRNLHFGHITTDIVANGNECTVITNEAYTLVINGTEHKIAVGENKFIIK